MDPETKRWNARRAELERQLKDAAGALLGHTSAGAYLGPLDEKSDLWVAIGTRGDIADMAQAERVAD